MLRFAVLYFLSAIWQLMAQQVSVAPPLQIVRNGSTVQFTADTGNLALSELHWRFNGQIIVGATNSSLLLTNVQPVNEGIYQVIASTSDGPVESNPATLQICWQVQLASVEKDLPPVIAPGEAGDTYKITPLVTNIVVNGALAVNGFVFTRETAAGEVLWRRDFPTTNEMLFPEYNSYFSSNSPLYFIAHSATLDGSSNSFVAMSIALDGQIQWIRPLTPVFDWSRSGRYAPAITAGSDGNIYLSGAYENDGEKASRRTNAFALTRLDANGRVLWASQPDNPTNAPRVGPWAFDTNGSFFVSGIGGNLAKRTVVTAKLDPEGESVWTSIQAASGDPTVGGFYVDSISFGPSEEILLDYVYWPIEFAPQTILLELSAAGDAKWTFNAGAGSGWRVAYDPAGSLYVHFVAIYQRFVLWKYDANGRFLWGIETTPPEAGFPYGQFLQFSADALRVGMNGEITVRGSYSPDGVEVRGVLFRYVENAAEDLPLILNRYPNSLPTPVARSARVVENRALSLDLPVSGEEPLIFQWLLNGAPLIGVTNRVLSIPNVQLTNSGTYSLFVSNRVGCALSDDVSIQVIHVEPTLLAAHNLVGGETTNRYLSLNLHGNASQMYYLEVSNDLVEWHDAGPVWVGPTGSIEAILERVDPAAAQQFFRARFNP